MSVSYTHLKYNFHVREMAFPMLMVHVGIAIERILRHNYIHTERDYEEMCIRDRAKSAILAFLFPQCIQCQLNQCISVELCINILWNDNNRNMIRVTE